MLQEKENKIPSPEYTENVTDLRNFNVSVFFVQCINIQDDHARPIPSIFNTAMLYTREM